MTGEQRPIGVAVVAIYIAMLAFDFAVLAGTAWLVAQRGWSAWWFVFAFIVCVCSTPRGIIELTKDGNDN